MHLNISGYSTALFSTWYFIEELGLLLDAGDGLTSTLLQKARKIEHAFISHADRDHLVGLLQFNQLNAREDFPKIYYPFNCGSFSALEEFTKKFDPHVKGTIWNGIQENESIQIKPNIFVQSIRNNHVITEPLTFKSFGYQVYQTKSKLKEEYAKLSQQQINQLLIEIGKEKMSEISRTNLLTYSGDTPVDYYEKWNNTKILIHEATFLEKAELDKLNIRGNKHSSLEEVLKMVGRLNIETLILGHFSSRYSGEQINDRVRFLCKEYKIKIPVYTVLPGISYRDILKSNPIN